MGKQIIFSVLICLFSLGFLSGFANGAPEYYDLNNVPESPVGYEENASYLFTLKWSDEANDVDQVRFVFDGTEYSPDNVSELYSYELTNLSFGYYVYNWWGNDTEGNAVTTPNYVYEIESPFEETGNVCADSDTLKKTIVRQLCDDDGCETITLVEFTECSNGCYEGQCKPEDTNQLFLLLLFVIVIGVAIYLFMRDS